MQYPDTVTIGGNVIKVNIVNQPLKKLDDKRYIIGMYEPLARSITQYHDDKYVDTCGESFVHEIVEAIHSLYDLKLPHQTITTLATGLYQAFKTGGISFKETQVGHSDRQYRFGPRDNGMVVDSTPIQ